jgi:hypothetical protein
MLRAAILRRRDRRKPRPCRMRYSLRSWREPAARSRGTPASLSRPLQPPLESFLTALRTTRHSGSSLHRAKAVLKPPNERFPIWNCQD